MAYTTIDNPELFFQTVLWTGNGSSSRSITLDGSEDMQPDWTWIKSRAGSESTQQHYLYDSVRGATKYLQSSTTNAEGTKSNGLSAFASDGFTIGDDNANNASSTTYVAWNWKAGTSFTNDASATGVGTIDSTGSINTTAGFSIISYSGTGTAGTIAHGLGSTPKMIIVKVRNFATNWLVQHGSIANTKVLYLDATNAETTDDSFNDTLPTSSVFSVKTANGINASGKTYIAYCFADVKGYSKIGKYIGNGNADGPFIYTGFRPAFIMYKNTARSISWLIHDNKRLGYNPDNDEQHPDTSAADGTDDRADILSNGFKIRESSNLMNVSGEQVIYMAFAESPFVNSNGVPNNAR